MATYNPQQLLNDYANGRMTPEMAVGHSLQHINLLYEAQANANANANANGARGSRHLLTFASSRPL